MGLVIFGVKICILYGVNYVVFYCLRSCAMLAYVFLVLSRWLIRVHGVLLYIVLILSDLCEWL